MTEKDTVVPLTISLPNALRAFISKQVASGDYSSTSDYVRELIRADRRRSYEKSLEATAKANKAQKKAQTINSKIWKELRDLLNSGDEALFTKRLNETAELMDAATTMLNYREQEPQTLEQLTNPTPSSSDSEFFKPVSASRLKRLFEK